jgi:hypothetical protein
MRKTAALASLGALMVLVPTVAAKPSKPDRPDKPNKPPKACTAHRAGYDARGSLIASALMPAGKGRYNGTIEVDVKKANHGAPTGDQTFTLTGAKVKFHHGVDRTSPAPGSEVGLHGTITKLPKGCSTSGFTPMITVKKVDIREAHSNRTPPHPAHPAHPTKPTKPPHPAHPAHPTKPTRPAHPHHQSHRKH